MNLEDLATKQDVENLKNSIDLLRHMVANRKEPDEILLLQEGADLIKMPFATFKKKVEKGLIPSSKIGKKRTVLKSDVMKLWNECRTPARHEVMAKKGFF